MLLMAEIWLQMQRITPMGDPGHSCMKVVVHFLDSVGLGVMANIYSYIYTRYSHRSVFSVMTQPRLLTNRCRTLGSGRKRFSDLDP